MAKHTGGAKMTKVEKKLEKNAPKGEKHWGHTGGVKMEKVEKTMEKERAKKNKSIKNLWGLLSVIMALACMVCCLASCGSNEVKTYTTEQLAEKYETDDPSDFKDTKMYITGQFYQYKGDTFYLVPVDYDGDGYGVEFKCKDYGKTVKKAAKKADAGDDVKVLGTITKISNDGYVIKVESLEVSDMVSE